MKSDLETRGIRVRYTGAGWRDEVRRVGADGCGVAARVEELQGNYVYHAYFPVRMVIVLRPLRTSVTAATGCVVHQRP